MSYAMLLVIKIVVLAYYNNAASFTLLFVFV